MSIGSQVFLAIKLLSEDKMEDAIVAASVCLSATARLEHPTMGDKAAWRAFLNDYLPIINKVGWVAFGISQPISFYYKSLDSRITEYATRSVPEMLYDVVRCTALHEAKIPDNLYFLKDPIIKLGNNGELCLPIDIIMGLLIAVVSSHKNAGEYIKENPIFSFNGLSKSLNEFWGKRQDIERFIGIS